jgi:hypothetical protein
MEAMTFTQAMQMAQPPVSRFVFGSPCRFVPRCDFTFHMLVPALLRKGDTTNLSTWDHGRLWLSARLNSTSPRWQHLVNWRDR